MWHHTGGSRLVTGGPTDRNTKKNKTKNKRYARVMSFDLIFRKYLSVFIYICPLSFFSLISLHCKYCNIFECVDRSVRSFFRFYLTVCFELYQIRDYGPCVSDNYIGFDFSTISSTALVIINIKMNLIKIQPEQISPPHATPKSTRMNRRKAQ